MGTRNPGVVQGVRQAGRWPSLPQHQEGRALRAARPQWRRKATTLKIATGLLTPDRGVIYIRGIDAIARPVEAKQIMAWLPDEPLIYDKLSPLEYLEFVACLWGVDAD